MNGSTIWAAMLLVLLAVSAESRSARADDARAPDHLVLPDTPPATGPIQALPFLHEGLQLTYWNSWTALPGNAEEVIKAEPGTLEDPNSGWTVYTKTTHATRVMAIAEETFARIDGDKVIMSSEVFSLLSPFFPASAPPISVAKTSSIVQAGDSSLVSGDWLEPALLDQYFKTPPLGCKARRGPWKVEDHTFDAVIFSSHLDTVEFLDAYDAQTGLLLYRGVISQGPPPVFVAPGDVQRGDVMLQFQALRAMRDLKIPWAAEPMPDWVGHTNVLHFQGTFGIGGSPGVRQRLDISITDDNDGWARTETRIAFGSQQAADKRQDVWGSAEFGGLWAGPASFATFQKGQLLDDDPITKTRTFVRFIDNKSIVVASANGTGVAERDWRYDKATGMLTGQRVISGAMLPVRRTDVNEELFVGKD